MLGNWISDASAPLIMPSHSFHVSAFAAVSVARLDHASASPHLQTKPDFRITQALLPTLVLALALACLPSHAAPTPISVPVKNLVLDLDASVGVESDSQERVLSWTNRVHGFPAQKFVPNDKGRKVPGSGIPSLLKAEGDRKFPAVLFRQQELINDQEDAFDALIQGKGHTWYAVVAVYDQTSVRKNTHAIFGNLRNSTAAGGGTGGNYEGFWGVMHNDRRVYAGVRNGINFERNGPNNPEVLSRTALEKFRYYVVAGRMGAGSGTVAVEVFVDRPVAENTSTVPVNPKADPSRMAIGQERDATNHPGDESFDGELARLIIYDRAHDAAEMAATFETLIKHYGIKVTAPDLKTDPAK